MADTSLSLLDRLAAGDDPESWRRLTDIYTPLLHGWLRRHQLQPTDVDDVVQDVLLHVARQLSSFRHNGRTGAFRCWLRQVLVHRLRKHWNHAGRRPAATGGTAFLDRLNQLEDPTSGLSRQWDREHDRHVANALIQRVRERLNEQTWEVFQRTVMTGESPAVVAQNLGMTANAVYAVRFRVLQLLRQEGRGLLDTGFGGKLENPSTEPESA